MKQRRLAGPFTAKNLGMSSWQLTSEPPGRQILLRGVGADAAALLSLESLEALDIEWCADGAQVVLTERGAVRLLAADSAIIHEPKAHLYEALPLAKFDAGAKRFWRRVFRLMRIPGGRFLLGLLARGRRAPRNAGA